MTATALLAEVRDAGFLVRRSHYHEKLLVLSPHNCQLPAGLRVRLLANKTALLRHLERRERADDSLAATFHRIAAAYRPGCPVSGSEWEEAERAMDKAYRLACDVGDFTALDSALAEYERLAFSVFRSSGHGRSPEDPTPPTQASPTVLPDWRAGPKASRGYVRNDEDRRGRPARLVVGEPMPEEQQLLPTREELEGLHGCS